MVYFLRVLIVSYFIDAKKFQSVKTVVISANATSSRATTRNNRYSKQHVNRNDVNSITVLVSSYRYEHADDIIPVCRWCVGGWGNDSLVLTLVRQKNKLI